MRNTGRGQGFVVANLAEAVKGWCPVRGVIAVGMDTMERDIVKVDSPGLW